MRVAYLGPEGTNTHEALLTTALGGEELLPLASNHDVVVAVQDGRADRALAPLENSVEGGVNATIDALTFDAPGVVIVGELVHHVRHCLVAAPGTTELGLVVSHGQALAQCSQALRRLAPGARVEAVASTAGAVQRAAREPGVGAIGTRTAAERHGAHVLAADIQDRPDNATRFVFLAPAGTPALGRADKSSIVFHGHGDASPGWLVACLTELSDRGVNLSRIESRPLRSKLGHYLFHVDIDGAAGTEPVDAALAALRPHCEGVRVLGAYQAAASVDPVAIVPVSHGGDHTT